MNYYTSKKPCQIGRSKYLRCLIQICYILVLSELSNNWTFGHSVHGVPVRPGPAHFGLKPPYNRLESALPLAVSGALFSSYSQYIINYSAWYICCSEMTTVTVWTWLLCEHNRIDSRVFPSDFPTFSSVRDGCKFAGCKIFLCACIVYVLAGKGEKGGRFAKWRRD